ncbi:MAG: HAD family hydrolase, partial [Coprobacillus sp.]
MSNIKIVFSDIDGTLLNDQHQITEKTLQSIHLLQEKNIPFVIVSARSPSGIYSILNEYHFMCPIIAYNGGVVLDEKKEIVFQEGMSIKRAREIIDY